MPMLILNNKDIAEIIAKHYNITPEQVSIVDNRATAKIEMPLEPRQPKPVCRSEEQSSYNDDIHKHFDH